MRCSCFGGSSVNRKKGTAAGTLHGIDGDLLQDINHLSYNELRSATDNFHTSNKIGRGGFGTVYKGILRSGTQVAVKTLSAQSKQGVPEFLNEIKTISKVKHPNLVELIGCCAQGTNRILVYEYVENNSLDRALLGSTSTDIKLDWGRRSAICHISTRIAGTTSSKPSWGGTQKLLLEWAWTLHEEGKPLELVDPEMGEFPGEEVIRYIKVAFFCTQSAANRRPRMIQVVDMLSKQIQLNDNQLTAPGFLQDSDNPSGGASSTKNFNAASNGNQMSSGPVIITEVIPR
ncbi:PROMASTIGOTE SURFACE ANTIGEN PROTEIN PSA [Salix purpurea]|uniref:PROMASTIGOTE SURFACE ANTIGEN PROTEIN PSA n=1 Tax=Salix purpurea TaxID=77065 RepID=A0A9Q0WMK5_SALPP|nr:PROMASTIGOTE SURFACE ANTIGEN PROTEIN PSA [Salix purpurea]